MMGRVGEAGEGFQSILEGGRKNGIVEGKRKREHWLSLVDSVRSALSLAFKVPVSRVFWNVGN